jgi:hypothetical protein
MDAKDIENRFTYHKPDEHQAAYYELLRNTAKQFAKLIDTVCPEGREKALAITNLEQSVMWANAAIARSSEQK